MRISVDKRDKGHRFDLDLTRVRVYLDDAPFTRAVTADEEDGLIVAYKHDEEGRAVVNPDGNAFVLETLRGKVRIEVLGDDGQSIRMPKVKVERTSEGVQVMVYSRIRSNNIRRLTLKNSTISGMSERQLAQTCGVAAGAGAEHLCEQFGDIFDPSLVALAGIAACEELMAREAQAVRH
jgi:hypothetical protein